MPTHRIHYLVQKSKKLTTKVQLGAELASELNTRMDTKQFIQEYVEARGGKDALSEDEKKALVELAKKKDDDA